METYVSEHSDTSDKQESSSDNPTVLETLSEVKEWAAATDGSSREDNIMTSFHVKLAGGNVHYASGILISMDDKNLLNCLLNTPVNPCLFMNDESFPTSKCTTTNKVISCDAPTQGTSRTSDRLRHLPWTPLSIACFSGEPDLVKLLVRYGASLDLKDAKGNNVIHYIVYLSEKYPKRALAVYKALVEYVDNDVLRILVNTENNDKLIPIDIAADLSMPEILTAILRTDGVYRNVVRNCGTHIHVRYDVTRYETKGGCKIHLLYYLSCITEQELKRVDRQGMFKIEPIASWIEAKHLQYLRLVYVSLVEWLLLLFMYFGTLVYSTLYISLPPKPWTITLTAMCCLSLAVDVLNMYFQSSCLAVYWRRIRAMRFPVSSCGIYRIYHVIFCITVIILCGTALAPDTDLSSDVYLGLNVCCILFGFISIAFFSQLNERLGHLLTAVEKMVIMTCEFTLFIFVVFLAVSLSFYVLHFHPYACQNVTDEDNNTRMVVDMNCSYSSADVDPDAVMFSTFSRSLHETLLLALGIMAPQSIYFTQSESPPLAITLYILCLFCLTIVMLNLLLALVNKRVRENRRS